MKGFCVIVICLVFPRLGESVSFISVYELGYIYPAGLYFEGTSVDGQVINGEIYLDSSDSSGCSPYLYNRLKGKFVLVTGYQCATKQKALNAQQAGAVGVLIQAGSNTYNPKYLHNEFDPKPNEQFEHQGQEPPMEEDDLERVKIPCFVIQNSVGNDFRDYTRLPSIKISVKIDKSDLIFHDNRLQVDLWTSSQQEFVDKTMTGFAEFPEKLKPRVKFQPRYFSAECQECKTSNFTFASPNCTDNGRFCAPMVDYSVIHTGLDVVLDDTRQKCIWYQNNNRYDRENRFFGWLYHFNKLRHKYKWDFKRFVFHDDCAYHALYRCHTSRIGTQDCVRGSFEGTNPFEGRNWLMRRERTAQQRDSVTFYPALTLDRKLYHGEISTGHILDHICRDIINKPFVCTRKQELFSNTLFEVDEQALNIVKVFIASWSLALVVTLVLFVRLCKSFLGGFRK